MSSIDKTKAILMSIWMLVILLSKKILAVVLYPIAYPLLMKGYAKKDGNVLQWLLWLFADQEQEDEYGRPIVPEWYYRYYYDDGKYNETYK